MVERPSSNGSQPGSGPARDVTPATPPARLAGTNAAPRFIPEGHRSPLRPAVDEDLRAIIRKAEGGALTDPAFQRARDILEEAYESATELRLAALARIREQEAQTERQANAIISRARGDAERTAAQAAMEAQLALQRAQRTADEMVARARAEGEEVLAEARRRAADIADGARSQAVEVYDATAESLKAARERQAEMQKAEAEFETAVATFLRWVGLPEDQAAGSLRNVLRRK